MLSQILFEYVIRRTLVLGVKILLRHLQDFLICLPVTSFVSEINLIFEVDSGAKEENAARAFVEQDGKRVAVVDETWQIKGGGSQNECRDYTVFLKVK